MVELNEVVEKVKLVELMRQFDEKRLACLDPLSDHERGIVEHIFSVIRRNFHAQVEQAEKPLGQELREQAGHVRRRASRELLEHTRRFVAPGGGLEKVREQLYEIFRGGDDAQDGQDNDRG